MATRTENGRLKARVFGLDLMRALAILGVVGIHSITFIPEPWQGSLRRIGPAFFGALGVEMFFVLSGYLVGSLLLRVDWLAGGGHALGSFLYRRWMRTLPNYFLFLAANLAFLWIVAGDRTFDWRFLFFLQNFAWPHPGFFPEAWSLSIEEWFYIIASLALFSLTRSGMATERALAWTFVVLFVAPLAARIVCARLGWSWEVVRTTVVLRLDAIMYGVAGALLHRRYPDAWVRFARTGLFAGVVGVLIAWGTILLVPRATFLMKVLYFPLLGVVLALCLPAASQWRARRESMSTIAVRRVALWSYSLYLCNLLVLRLIDLAIPMPRSDAASWATFGLFWVGSFVLAAAAYHFWEKPIMDLRDRKPSGDRQIRPGTPRPDL